MEEYLIPFGEAAASPNALPSRVLSARRRPFSPGPSLFQAAAKIVPRPRETTRRPPAGGMKIMTAIAIAPIFFHLFN